MKLWADGSAKKQTNNFSSDDSLYKYASYSYICYQSVSDFMKDVGICTVYTKTTGSPYTLHTF